MALTRFTGLLLGLAFTLAATWYAAGLDTDDDGLLADAAAPPRAAAPAPMAAAPTDTAQRDAHAPRMAGEAGNLFAAHSWQPPAPPPPVAVRAPPPQAPPLPYRYVGRMEEDGAVVVFLAEGGAETRPRLVRQGDQWPNYRVDEITAQGMRLTYLPLNETQRLLFGSPN
jgi:hypothetical protein